MEQNASSEADSHAASQGIPRLLRNPKAYYGADPHPEPDEFSPYLRNLIP
jgi:hypothetical protein